MNENKNELYNKKIDVGLKKKSLEEKYGAHFSTDPDLSPEFEMEWLNYIEEFEKQFNEAQKTTVWKYIGRPSFKKLNEIESNNISGELNKLLILMDKNNIFLDTVCGVDDKKLYRFITEELFLHEMDDIKIEGMIYHFIYEDFYPNAENDIRNAFDYFFRMSMSKMENIGGNGYDLLYVDTENYEDSKGNKIEKSEVLKRITAFLDSFDYFEIISNEVKDLYINESKTDAKLTFDIHYKGCFFKNKEFVNYKGTGIFRFKPSEYGGWSICHLTLPGLQL